MNVFKVAILMGLLMALFMGIGYLAGGQSGMLIAFVFAAAMNFGSYWFSDKIILRMYQAREVSETDHPRLYRIIKRLALNAQIPMPKVFIVPSRAPNAFATGRDPHHAAVAATEGVLELLNDDELEGVMAHEIGHIVNRDMLIGTIAATFAGAIGMIAHMLQWAAIFGGGRSNGRDSGSPITLIAMAILSPIIAMMIQMAISRSREYKADAEGGRLSGKYLGLASALEKLEKAPIQMNLDKTPATAHLMIANPLSGKGLASLFSTHPPMEERIKRLREMATETPYRVMA